MNRRSIFHAIAVLSFVLLVLISGGLAVGQGADLLVNGGFEAPFVNQGGEPPRQVAQGWNAWHVPAAAGAPTFQNQQPEYLPAAPDTTRIHGGSNAQLVTSFFATFTGGVYQEVSGAQPGTDLQFSVYGYVWSSAFDDVNVSEMDGGVVVQVGIDPNGGTDPASTDIIWSAASQRYDQWSQYTVSAPAEANTVSVWVRASVSAPAKNNNVYLDDATLTTAGGAVSTATSTPIPAATATFTLPPAATATFTQAALPTATQPGGGATQEQLGTATNTVVFAPTFTPTSAGTEAPRPTVDPNVFLNTIVHVVQPGDSVSRLARLYGSTVDAIVTANDLNDNALIFVGQRLLIPVRLPPVVPATQAPSTQAPATATLSGGILPTAVPPSNATSYVIQPGDTLGSIARRFNTTVGTLAQLNGIVNPDRILWGQRLILPSAGNPPPTATPVAPPTATQVATTPATYVVQPGDSLYRISIQNNVPLSQLIQLNSISDPNLIYVGQTLVLR
jgi:LysM repeat protein